MTLPRQVIPGRTYLITRRCTQRQFLLRPDPVVTQTFLYCLGEAAERYRVTLHGWLAMSNHEHLVVRDNRGNLPEFLAHFHKMTAKALNAHWCRRENLWASEQPSAVFLVEDPDRFEKLIYLLVNPAAGHIVDRVADWPGACSLAQHYSGRPKSVKRPRGFFSDDGPMPREVTLRAERLEGYEGLSHEEWASKIARAVHEAEQKARETRARTGLRVFGRKAVLRAAHSDRPDTTEPRRTLRPSVACRDVARRIDVLRTQRAFRVAYRRARMSFLAGDTSVVFPPGTYRMIFLAARRTPITSTDPPS
jgi:REP element-mobilizing transposase RayT